MNRPGPAGRPRRHGRRGERRRARRQYSRVSSTPRSRSQSTRFLELAELKKTGRCQKLVVTGCLAERYRGELQQQIGEIDAVLGTGEVPDIVRAVTAPAGARPDAGVPMRLFRKPPATKAPAEAAAAPARVPLRRRHAPHPRDAEALRLRQRWRRAATTPARSASFRRCAGTTAAAKPQSILTEARRLAESRRAGTAADFPGHEFFGVDRGERGALARLLYDLNRVDGLE